MLTCDESVLDSEKGVEGILCRAEEGEQEVVGFKFEGERAGESRVIGVGRAGEGR